MNVMNVVEPFVQLDIFNFVVEQKKDALEQAVKGDPSQLVVGDYVEFMSNSGHIMEGHFITKGFWDGRDQECPEYYYFDVNGRFFQFDPYRCAWTFLHHDDDYVKPDKTLITERLIQELKEIPFINRLEYYRSQFENKYPYLSYEYHPHVYDAWNKAIVEVTTMEDVLLNLKHWSIREKFPKEVIQFIEEKILPLNSEERFKELFKMEWKDVAWREGKKKFYCTKRFSEKNFTVYKSLFTVLIQKTNNTKELISLLSIWGINSKLDKESLN